MTRNTEIAAVLDEYADRIEAQGSDYKPRAYRRAADNVRDYPEPIEELAADGEDAVSAIEGVGESIAEKIVEYVETGHIEALEEVRAELPVDIAELTAVEGVGPRTVGDLYRELGVETLDDLEEAARDGRIRDVSGYGEKTEQNILEKIEFAREAQERELLGEARPIAEDVLAYFRDVPAVGRAELAGSLRRWKETIGDVDLLAESDDLQAVVDAFTDWERVDDVIEAGSNKASVRAAGFRIDLRVVVPEEFGSALQYFTGNKEHNIRLRTHAISQGLKVNEYGVFDVSEIDDPDAGQRVGERIAGETEESIYEAVGVPWMPPELREGRGEIEAARENRLPVLLEEGDVRGDLHIHTEWSDGGYSIEDMVTAAAEFGHEYVCITDHATGPGIVSGLSDDELREQIDAIRTVEDDADIDVFAGVEANVDADGNLTTSDDVLDALDLVVASIHSSMNMNREAATERLTEVARNPLVDVIGHPSTRLINQRPGLEFDVETVAAAAADNDTALEVNSNPHRLDLWGSAVQVAVDNDASIAISTDAHSPGNYELLRYGVHTARRGWAEAADVINARDASDLRSFLH